METFYISDTHFGQESILKFKKKDGTPLRDFTSVEEMDQCIVDRWNKVVGKNDKVYHLGDVVKHKKDLRILDRLNGKKTLISGNHDIYISKYYLRYFKNVRGCKMYPDLRMILTHLPVHPKQLEYKFKYNVHGHMHSYVIEDDIRYLNICVEQINYTPISMDEILKKLKDRCDV